MTIADPADLYRSGLGLVQIAAQLGTSTSKVRQQIATAGVEIRPRGRPKGSGFSLRCVDCREEKRTASGLRCAACNRLTRQHAAANTERTEVIATAYRSGLSMGQIGIEHGLSRERVRQILVKAGQDRRPAVYVGTGRTREKIQAANARREERRKVEEKVLTLWRQGLTCRQISEAISFQYSGVRSIVARRGSRRQVKPPKDSQALLTIDKAFRATRLRSEGKTKSEVAKALGVPRNSVGRLYKLGDEARAST